MTHGFAEFSEWEFYFGNLQVCLGGGWFLKQIRETHQLYQNIGGQIDKILKDRVRLKFRRFDQVNLVSSEDPWCWYIC